MRRVPFEPTPTQYKTAMHQLEALLTPLGHFRDESWWSLDPEQYPQAKRVSLLMGAASDGADPIVHLCAVLHLAVSTLQVNQWAAREAWRVISRRRARRRARARLTPKRKKGSR